MLIRLAINYEHKFTGFTDRLNELLLSSHGSLLFEFPSVWPESKMILGAQVSLSQSEAPVGVNSATEKQTNSVLSIRPPDSKAQ